jgi:ABC-type branched-subunit amino acid transport system ATPase component
VTSDTTTATLDLDERDQVPALAISARGLRLRGRRGDVYGAVDVDVPTGELVVVQGPQGAGRSSLLLTLAGRMVPGPGSRLVVLGEPLPARRRAVQRRSAVAGFVGIDELDEAITVGAALRERLAWTSPWWSRVPRVDQRTLAAHLAPVFGPRPLPNVGTVAWDLDEVDAMLLRIALATLRRPDLLVVDDVDHVHDDARRQMVWSALERLRAGGVTVVAAVASLDEVSRMDWARPPLQLNLATGPHAVPVA